ncbi:MAG: response regulator [Sulfurovum sp.]|uniref:response regulator n=1 Tax=Sulfurovum sp. TaxID=1969726 RepID=UPI002867F0AB|nr:response regulator [Sulfurovum sp.]MCO4844864.1 response regulator [Sulfurovum sp.]
MSLPQNILIVEDEVITQRYLQEILTNNHMNVSGCFDNASDTLEALKHINCDMILMDINIKGSMDGIQLSKKILDKYTFPIVFITAHNDDATLEELLELAPYGFISKPFSSKEVLVTLKIAYKRYLIHSEVSRVNTSDEPTDIVINEYYTYSRNVSVLYYDGQAIKLNKKQGQLLEILSKNINHTVRYDTLISELWEDDTVADSTLRTLVYSVRKLLPDLPIVSHSKVGYSLQSSHSV